MRDVVQDRYGNTIYLTDERWKHIVEHHPELNGHRADVLNAIRAGKRRQAPLFPDTFYYKKIFPRLQGRLKQIEVVVLFRWKGNQPNNFVLTAYPV